MDKVELVKSKLSSTKKGTEKIKTKIEEALLSEKICDLSSKEEALTILAECTYCIKVITRFINLAIEEAGKSIFDSRVVLAYVNEIDYYYNEELDNLIDKYNIIQKKRAEEKNKA